MRRKIYFCVSVFALSFLFSLTSTTESSANEYGGVCCQRQAGNCNHPGGDTYDLASWVGGAETCTGHEEQSQ